jgi:hypothetical protein
MKKVIFILAMLGLGTLCWQDRHGKTPPTGWTTQPA